MSRHERKARDREERGRRIVDAAARIAEQDGWPAVTIRRLADHIEYSAPVLYDHFPGGRAAIVNAVAVDGCRRLADEVTIATADAAPDGRLRAAIEAYLEFAQQNPATYQAMFTLEISTEFATENTPPELRDAFAALAAVVDDGVDAGTRAELLWSTLHGVSTLTRDGRLPASNAEARLNGLVRMLSS
ncbi:TetR/AcrR family transcriptional regulator [Nocardia sp. NPDC052566]|uniref:TetR/AcrR family transcriptional regulator n=1 Tax=Nocardia sp. NPDC052566 TaxID=3364330 RepID=UPI0037C53956